MQGIRRCTERTHVWHMAVGTRAAGCAGRARPCTALRSVLVLPLAELHVDDLTLLRRHRLRPQVQAGGVARKRWKDEEPGVESSFEIRAAVIVFRLRILVAFVILEGYQNWAMRYMKAVWDY